MSISRTRAPQDYYKDTNHIPNEFGHSVYLNFAGRWNEQTLGLNKFMNPLLDETPDAQVMKGTIEQMNLVNSDPNMDWGTWMATGGAGMLGSALNPSSWPFFAAGGVAGRVVASTARRVLTKVAPSAMEIFSRPLASLLDSPITKWLPEKIGKEGEEKTLSMALTGKHYAESFGQFAGMGVPESINANFDEDTKHIQWGGVIHAMGVNGAMGMAIDSVPFAYGVLKAKLNRGLNVEVQSPITHNEIQQGIERGLITKDEGEWLQRFDQAKKNPSDHDGMLQLTKDASSLIKQNGHDVNMATHKAPLEIVKPETMEALNGAQADLVAADLEPPYKTAAFDYLVNNDLDRFRADPTLVDGLRGAHEHMSEKLSFKLEKLKEADAILDKYLHRGMTDHMDFSQKGMLRHLKKAGFESSHVSGLPMTMPENMVKWMKAQEKIDKLKFKLAKEKKKFNNKTFYRGESPEYPGQKVQYQMLNNDTEFGKGFWYAESMEHAKHYGHAIEELKGNYKLYDVVTGKDAELNVLYGNIKKLIDERKFDHVLEIAKNIFRNAAIKKGYEGLIRREGWADKYGLRTRVNDIVRAKKEIMFFERPKNRVEEFIPNKQTLKRINELEEKKPKILTPKEEMSHIREKLLGKEGLPDNFKTSKEYHRLRDLANVWHNAKTLLDRVHLEDTYKQQEAFAKIAKSVIDAADSLKPKQANPDAFAAYLRKRMEGYKPVVEPLASVEKQLKANTDVPANADQLLDANKERVNDIKSENGKKYFVEADEKFREFKSSERVFEDFVTCILGSQ